MNAEPFLSICITSYNRPAELKRGLESIDADPADIEIIVSEDKSPKREEIAQTVDDFKKETDYNLSGNFNEVNLGYDGNLAKLISLAKGEYILFMSDDDAFNAEALSYVIKVLKEKTQAFMYTAYSGTDSKALNRKYDKCFEIKAGIKSVNAYLYDGILFSGLIFRRECIRGLISDMDRFINTNYFQIYLVAKMLYKFGGYYDNIELINCIGDGENGYGTTELSKKDPLLADRNSIFSNMQFNKGLIKVIKIFDEEEKTKAIKHFQKEYSLRTYRGLSAARAVGKDTLKEYWRRLKSLDIKIRFPAGVYYRTLLLFGCKFSDALFGLPRRILYAVRRKR